MRRRDGSPARIPSSASILHLSRRRVAAQQATYSGSSLPCMDELDGDAVQPDHCRYHPTHKQSFQRNVCFLHEVGDHLCRITSMDDGIAYKTPMLSSSPCSLRAVPVKTRTSVAG